MLKKCFFDTTTTNRSYISVYFQVKKNEKNYLFFVVILWMYSVSSDFQQWSVKVEKKNAKHSVRKERNWNNKTPVEYYQSKKNYDATTFTKEKKSENLYFCEFVL